MSETSFRLRINFTKEGRLRYLSHLEMARCMERCIRRAKLPFAISQGFSPHMRTAFGWVLGVGIASLDEYIDIWLTEYVAPADVLSAFEGVLPQGIRILGARYIMSLDKSLTEEFPYSRYECIFENADISLEEAQNALLGLLDTGCIKVVRKKKEKIVYFEGLLVNTPEFKRVTDGLTEGSTDRLTEGSADGLSEGTTDGLTEGLAGRSSERSTDGFTEGPADNALSFELVTYTEGKGSLRADLFCKALLERCPSLGSVLITRLEQISYHD